MICQKHYSQSLLQDCKSYTPSRVSEVALKYSGYTPEKQYVGKFYLFEKGDEISDYVKNSK